jgi:hypothetical protein
MYSMRETAECETLYSNCGNSRAGVVIGVHHQGVGEFETSHGSSNKTWSYILGEGERGRMTITVEKVV